MVKKNQIYEVFASTGLKEKNFKNVTDVYFKFMDKKCSTNNYLCNIAQGLKSIGIETHILTGFIMIYNLVLQIIKDQKLDQ